MGNFAENLNLGNRFRPPLFEALKGLLLKNAPYFLPDFCRKCHATTPEHD